MPKHIELKDKGDLVAQDLGKLLSELRSTMIQMSIQQMLLHANDDKAKWYRYQNLGLVSFKSKVNKVINTQGKKILKEAKSELKSVGYNQKQSENLIRTITGGINALGTSTVKQQQESIKEIRSSVTPVLFDAISKHIQTGIKNMGVVYQDGKNYQFDTYMEMKVRTDIQNEISENMIQAGADMGVVFYTTSCFGDCAKDHAPWQGLIYYDKDYASIVPADRLEEVSDYISSHGLRSVQDVKDNDPWLTTRPNCRHWFEPLTIDEVLGIKDNKDLTKKREDMGLNFNGTYQPKKYEAMQQQRANERAIRSLKDSRDVQEKLYASSLKSDSYTPARAVIAQNKIKALETKIRDKQADQRALLKRNPELQRQYNRESNGTLRADLGVSKPITGAYNQEIEKALKKSVNVPISKSIEYAVDYKKINGSNFQNQLRKTLGLENKRILNKPINDMLAHRSGTNGEDLIVFNVSTKKVVVCDEGEFASTCCLNEEGRTLLESSKDNEVICIHNHPAGLPPSYKDINSMSNSKFKFGLILTHDGKIYKYTGPQTEISANRYASKFNRLTFDKYHVSDVKYLTKEQNKEIQLEVLKRFSKDYGFTFEEVTKNG